MLLKTEILELITYKMKKALGETQTLHTGCSKAEPKKNSPHCRPPFQRHRTAKI